MRLYEGPWPYSETDRSVPASVRLRNIGAIGATRDGHEHRFGAMSSTNLPASDGSSLPTPAFAHVYGGCAYYGHYVIRRASEAPGVVSINSILTAYSTGSQHDYMKTVAADVGIGIYDRIDLWRNPSGYLTLYKVMIAMGRWEAAARRTYSSGYEAFNRIYDESNQAVVDEMWWGMIHGCREAWRDAGYQIEVTPEELTYESPVEASEPQEPRQQQQQEVDRDPLIHGWSGWRTVITGALGALSTFLSSLFELLGFEQAQKLGEVSAQILIGLAVVFLILKFWKRFETILKGRIK